jgi:hypothetical protein
MQLTSNPINSRRPPPLPATLQVHSLDSISLLDGESYYVTLVAWNGAGPPLSYNRSSKPVLVDMSGPAAGAVFNT